MIYEQQFLEYALNRQTIDPDMVLMYPAPTILSKHTIVALTDKGARFKANLFYQKELHRFPYNEI
jgi:hypothetical protein